MRLEAAPPRTDYAVSLGVHCRNSDCPGPAAYVRIYTSGRGIGKKIRPWRGLSFPRTPVEFVGSRDVMHTLRDAVYAIPVGNA